MKPQIFIILASEIMSLKTNVMFTCENFSKVALKVFPMKFIALLGTYYFESLDWYKLLFNGHLNIFQLRATNLLKLCH